MAKNRSDFGRASYSVQAMRTSSWIAWTKHFSTSPACNCDAPVVFAKLCRNLNTGRRRSTFFHSTAFRCKSEIFLNFELAILLRCFVRYRTFFANVVLTKSSFRLLPSFALHQMLCLRSYRLTQGLQTFCQRAT